MSPGRQQDCSGQSLSLPAFPRVIAVGRADGSSWPTCPDCWLICALVHHLRAGYGVSVMDTVPMMGFEWVGMHPYGKSDFFVARLPHRPQSLDGLRYRIGFTVDIAGYSSRTTEAQQAVQCRLFVMLRRFADEVGIAFDPASFQPAGDGYHYFLPDVDPHAAVRHLVRTVPRLLHEDNLGQDDRLRLRMAVDVGPVKQSVLGFAGPTVTRFCRLADSDPIRHAMKTTDTDIAIFVSDTLYDDIVRQYDDLSSLPFERREVMVKNYHATAHLLV